MRGPLRGVQAKSITMPGGVLRKATRMPKLPGEFPACGDATQDGEVALEFNAATFIVHRCEITPTT